MEKLTMEEIDKNRDDMMDKRLGVLYKHTLRYLNSMFNIELSENYKYIYVNHNTNHLKIQFQRLPTRDYYSVMIEFSLSSGNFIDVIIKCSTKLGNKTVYHKYVNNFIHNKIGLIEDENMKQITQYFMNCDDFIKFVIKKYNRLYKTQYYNNLPKAYTFLLSNSKNKIFPKEIAKLIAKKLLFFLPQKN